VQDRAQSFRGRKAAPGRFGSAFAFRQQHFFLSRQQLMPLAADWAGERSEEMEDAARARPGASSRPMSAAAVERTNRRITNVTSTE
jgi:hypothetical protein